MARHWILATLAATMIIGCVGGDDDDDDEIPPGEEITPADMIDDLEDGDDAINDADGRSGDWYAFNDGTPGAEQTPGESDFTPEEGGPEGSAYAVHTHGSGFTDWGAGVGLDLNGADPASPDNTKGTYDASAYDGVVFWAKGNVSIRATVVMIEVIAEEEGGQCVEGSGEGEECSNGHGKEIALTEEWAQYQLPFAEITQDEGWGQPLAFDPATLASIMFMTGPDQDFDYWIDEVGFY